jgi:lipopolysaccharide export system protein LptA
MRATSQPRFTIERLRTLLLIGGLLLVTAIVVFLVGGQWTRRFLSKDLPNRLGINIEQQADGVNYTQTRKGKTIFRIHAARAIKMKSDGKTLLHDVKIDLYDQDGNQADTISGAEFEYDANAGVATAAGAVEIAMMRPGVKPAIAQMKPGSSTAKPQADAAKGKAKAAGSVSNHPSSDVAANPAPGTTGEITDNQIHVKTSGLVFNQKSGVATTTQRVDFALRQGSGNAMGAIYDSEKGQLILDRAVELHVERGGVQSSGGPVTVHAAHADFEREQMVCQLLQALAEYNGGKVQTANALIHFRDDGSVTRLDGSGGVDLQTETGGHVTAPIGSLDFDENNHPQHGLLQGGAHLELTQPNRQAQGSSPTAVLAFDRAGQLSQAHMEQGVIFNSQQQVTTAKGTTAQVRRSWKSQTADVAFAPVTQAAIAAKKPNQKQAQNHVEPRTIHGYGGVVVTSETTADGVVTPSRLSADTVLAELAPGGALSSLSGTGHASFEERTAQGAHQTSSSDQLDVRFNPVTPASEDSSRTASAGKSKTADAASEIASVVQVGHVVLVQDPTPSGGAARSGQAVSAPANASGIRATANRADYDGQTQILHLTGTPRVRDGALDMTANRIDFARASGDAFAHGDVRASWIGENGQGAAMPGRSLLAANGSASGGDEPVHAVAAEAELHQATQEVIFRSGGNASGAIQSGNLPRLWQSANSVTAPVITLNRQKQTLIAEANGAANPVRTVLVSNAPAPSSAGKTGTGKAGSKAGSKAGQDSPSVIRVRSGDLHYSEGERLALFHSGSAGSVTAETAGADGTANVVSQEVEVKLLPAGTHSGTGGSQAGNTRGQANTAVDRLTARGRVVVDWPDRRGTGEQLVYLSDDGTFTLTGGSGVPPRITDEAQGTVTGSALIYHSRDDSVTVEGDGGKTATDTQSRKQKKAAS